MTAEVAILNAGAVALAADSAVTIGGQKIYNSALKLFALSKVAPVAVMIYGSASLMNVPWETLIKSYRQNLGGKTFASLEEYSTSFLKYLEQHPTAFSEDMQTRWLAKTVTRGFRMIRQNFLEETKTEKWGQKIERDKILSIFNNEVDRCYSICSDAKFADGLRKKDFDRTLKKHKIFFREIAKIVFEEIDYPEKIAKKLDKIATNFALKFILNGPISGVVIAGYGEEQLYPSILTHEIEFIVDGNLKYHRKEKKSIAVSDEKRGGIVAFAQEEMVNTFMNGIHPSTLDMLQKYLSSLFDDLPKLFEGSKTVERDSQILLDGFFSKLAEHVNQTHVDPVLSMVHILPKEELAAMAEALVNLTAFKRRMTSEQETVGGPIDVLVISKGDGLVWVKRKHYFPPELNQRFFNNYFRGIKK